MFNSNIIGSQCYVSRYSIMYDSIIMGNQYSVGDTWKLIPIGYLWKEEFFLLFAVSSYIHLSAEHLAYISISNSVPDL